MSPPVSVSLDLTPNDTNLSFSRHVEDKSDIFDQNEDENSEDSSGDLPNVSDGGNELNINARMEDNNYSSWRRRITHGDDFAPEYR